MRLKSLHFVDFRNFKNLDLELRPGLNFFLGENGQGKTNLVEAVYLLCRGNSFRAVSANNFLRRDDSNHLPSKAKISGHFCHRDLAYHVQMLLKPGLKSVEKSVEINGKPVSSNQLMGAFPVILFSPESLAVIKEGPDQRRQLIDEILLTHEPRHARLMREFMRALKSRNRLLRNLAEGIGPRISTLDSLESLNKIYLLLATHFTSARVQALNDLKPAISEAMNSILDERNVDIAVDYVISGNSALHWSESEIYDALSKRYLELHAQEAALGSSLVGPHKHDIKLLFSGNDSRFYCSQGQQRALILALKIAQIVYHHGVHQTFPILLLDDVMSELDAKKRGNLMKFLERISAQILITATDLTWSNQFGLERNAVFSMVDGTVHPAKI